MFHLLKRPLRLRPWNAETGQFSGLLPSFAYLRTHSSLHPLNKPASDHPDIGQRKQRDELRGVFGQPPVAHLGPHAGLGLSACSCNPPQGVCGSPGRMTLGDIVDVGGRCDDGVHQTGLRIYHGARLAQQAMGGQLGIDDLQNLRAQRVLFEQMTESQDADPVGNAQHHGQIKWWTPRIGHRRMRRNEREHVGPGPDVVHLFERDLPARVSGIEVKAEACLFHSAIARDLRASIEVIGVGF